MTDLSQWKVMLVDDEPDSLNLLADILALNGAQVYRAGSSAECLDMLQTIDPTLIVLDLAMPRPDGWELLSHIRANLRLAGVPVVAVTAYYSTRVAEEALEAGFDAFFPKPIRAAEFIDRLAEVVG